MALLIPLDVGAFLIGMGSTFAVKFLELYTKHRKKNIKPKLSEWNWEDIIYILFGGLFAMLLTPTSIIQAIIFGATWEALFIRLYKEATNKEKINDSK